jgi:hypothetical protein
LALAALPVAASQVTPAPRGWGTHEQLGDAGCWLRQVSGHPCPACGMTTAWAHAVRGNVLAAVEANLGGALLLGACVAAAACLLAAAAVGRWHGPRLRLRTAAWIATAWLAATLADWVRRLAEN